MFFLSAFALSDVLGRTKIFARSPRRISLYSAVTVDGPHFTIGTNYAVFCLKMHSAITNQHFKISGD
jgi:hypothetical protein